MFSKTCASLPKGIEASGLPPDLENLEKLSCCRVLFKFVVDLRRKNKDQEEGAIKV